jgi:hypothetical protein
MRLCHDETVDSEQWSVIRKARCGDCSFPGLKGEGPAMDGAPAPANDSDRLHRADLMKKTLQSGSVTVVP